MRKKPNPSATTSADLIGQLAGSDTRGSFLAEQDAVRRGLDEALRRGYSHVPVVAAVQLGVRVLRVGPGWVRIGVAAALAGGWPCLVLLAVAPFSAPMPGTGYLFVAAVTVVSISAFVFGWLAWTHAGNLTPEV